MEYLLRKAGLGQEESTPSSGRYDFMSQLTTQYRRSAVIHRGHAEPQETLGEGHGK
jgi:hypothetical protein